MALCNQRINKTEKEGDDSIQKGQIETFPKGSVRKDTRVLLRD